MPNLMGFTESGQTGSYSQSQTQLEGFLWMLDSDADDLAEILQEQLIAPLCDANWGDGLYPEFKLHPLSKSQIYSVIDVWLELVQAQAVTIGDADEDYVRELLGWPAKGRSEGDGGPGEDSGDDGGEAVGVGEEEPPEPGEEEPAVKEDMHDDHTFFPQSGSAQIPYKKFARIQRRVDFAAIERGSTMNEFVAEQDLGTAMADVAKHLADQVRTNTRLLEDPTELKKVKVPANLTAALKKHAKSALADSWDLGAENAKREVEKAGAKRMTKATFARFASIGEIAAKYFEGKAFMMAGGLSDEALSIFKNILLNGIKYSKSTDEVVDEIYRTFAQKGLIDEDTVREILGATLDVENPDYRLRTIIRTNGFDAINEARFSFFTDSALGGFVQALSYSAILDSRTTTICSELDDKVYALGSEVWEQYRPPNHYNCRSLLIAVTENDDVELTETLPTVRPQDGFK
jgi:SPP1 gp7 family putative phage head morphogenesis protein